MREQVSHVGFISFALTPSEQKSQGNCKSTPVKAFKSFLLSEQPRNGQHSQAEIANFRVGIHFPKVAVSQLLTLVCLTVGNPGVFLTGLSLTLLYALKSLIEEHWYPFRKSWLALYIMHSGNMG